MIAMDRQMDSKGVEQAGLAKHIRQMRSCRNKNNENYNKTNSFIQ